MRMLVLFAGTLALLGPALPVQADPYPQAGECGSAGQVALHRIEFRGADWPVFYIDDENVALGNGFSYWIEVNGVFDARPPGVYFDGLSNRDLQEGGQDPIVPSDPWRCTDISGTAPDVLMGI